MSTAADHFDRARRAAAEGDHREAVECYTRGLAESPRDVDALLERAAAYLNLRDQPRAIADFDALIKIKSDVVDWHLRRAMMLNAQCRYDEALVDYNRVFEIEPGHPKLHFLRAHANKNAGHWCEAIADFEIAALKEPELAQVCNSIVIKMRKLLSEDAESLGITPV